MRISTRYNSLTILSIILIFEIIVVHQTPGQHFQPNNPQIYKTKEYQQIKNTLTEKKIVIQDSPDKKGKEIQDTTIVVFSELTFYAVIYQNGRYKNEASVNWYWADTSHAINPQDTAIFLDTGKSLTYQPTKSDTGFIFAESLSSEKGDSTGVITILPGEKLSLISTSSNKNVITQGQENIFVSVTVQNVGVMTSHIESVNLEMIGPNSQLVTNDYQITRTDQITYIPTGQTRVFTFIVNANPDADTVLVSIDGKLITRENDYTNFSQKHQWQVQSPPQINIIQINPQTDEVFLGQDNISVLMHVTNNGMASVTALNPKLTFWYNGQNVSADYEYTLTETNPSIIEGHSSVEIELIVRVLPFATKGMIVINGNISCVDVNTGWIYYDDSAEAPASWVVTSTLAELIITSTKIICPNTNSEGDGEVNINQKFAVEITIRNRGGENVENVGVSMYSDGASIFLSNTSQLISSILIKQDHTITYNLTAYSDDIPTVEHFIAKIDSATSSFTGVQATIIPALDSLAQVQIETPAELWLQLKNPSLQIPVEQAFDVKASVLNPTENAEYDSTGTLIIVLPEGYVLVAGNPTEFFMQNTGVTWKVKPPDVPQGPDSILVYIDQKPRDQNNPSEYAQVKRDSVFMIVQTLETALSITDVSIIDPPGAIDGILSTEQDFIVSASIVTQKIENVRVQITIPESYRLKSDSIQNLGDNSIVLWSLQAPESPHDITKNMIIEAWGNQENDTTKIYHTSDSSLSITTVDKANLKVQANITSPPSAINGQIYPGLEFKIRAEIINSGQAEVYGDKSLVLVIEPQDRISFTVNGDTLLPVTDNFVEWTIRASQNLDDQFKIIKVKIRDVPNDVNTNNTAYIDPTNSIAQVYVVAIINVVQLELMVKMMLNVGPATISPGETDVFMGLEWTNLSAISGFPILIRLLKFDVEDVNNQLIIPESVISDFWIRDDDSVLGQANSLSQNPIEIQFAIPVKLDAQESEKLYMEVSYHENLSQQFKINLKDSSYINAFSPLKVRIVDEYRNYSGILNLRSFSPVITPKDFKKSFRNYPNPFGHVSQQKTHFVYYLPQDTDIELKIYTLLGELVWKCSYHANQPQGRNGLHQGHDLIWDGKNLRGLKVLNGVYIARIKTSYGDWAITKVAVIK